MKKIKYNNQKGNFLALIGRNNPEEIRLSKKIQKWASTLGGFLKTEDFILKNLPPKMFPSIRELQDHADFWMSDHARFWYYKEENEFMTFPSILLTDTGRAYYSLVPIGSKRFQLQYSKLVFYQLLKVDMSYIPYGT